VKFRFIADHRDRWPLEALCRVLEVSRQGFARYLRAPQTQREIRAHTLDCVVATVFEEHKGRYGSPRITEALQKEHALEVGKRRVEESMVRQGLFSRPPRKFVVTTKADPSHEPHPTCLNATSRQSARTSAGSPT
jgi:putative transposase